MEGMLATLHMALRPPLHLLGGVAGILDILLAELALHDGLLHGMNGRPTLRRSEGSVPERPPREASEKLHSSTAPYNVT